MEVKMDDLPILAFEKILSYLSLEDLIRCRGVSRRWHKTISSFKTKALCYSLYPSGHLFGKSRWLSGAFVQNFVSSRNFDLFFKTFDKSILSNLKRLRLFVFQIQLNCELKVRRTALSQTLNSFGQLEELDLIRTGSVWEGSVKLSLPMLKRIHVEDLYEMDLLVLDTPKLCEIKCADTYLELKIVHAESVERLVARRVRHINVEKLKNLKYLYIDESGIDDPDNDDPIIDSTFLSNLEQLEQLHLGYPEDVPEMFDQKRRYGRTGLKIFYFGLHLDSADDPAIIDNLEYLDEIFSYLIGNQSRLASEMPFQSCLNYREIEALAPGTEINLLKKLIDLDAIYLKQPVEDIERFLGLLDNFGNIVTLEIWGDQPHDLFNRLPEHCAVQKLTIHCAPSDFGFLFRLKHLMHLTVACRVDAEFIRKVLEELEFVSRFAFKYRKKEFIIKIGYPKRFQVWEHGRSGYASDVSSAIQLIEKHINSSGTFWLT